MKTFKLMAGDATYDRSEGRIIEIIRKHSESDWEVREYVPIHNDDGHIIGTARETDLIMTNSEIAHLFCPNSLPIFVGKSES